MRTIPVSRHAITLLCAAQFVVVLDATIVAVALPAIGRDLGFPGTGLSWVVSAYGLVFGGFLMLLGRVADLLGRRRVLLAGFAVFGTASLAIALAARLLPRDSTPPTLRTRRRLDVAGAVCATTGLAALLLALPGAGAPVALPAFLVMGLGVGCAAVAATAAGTEAVEPERRGLASGLLNTAAQLGNALGPSAFVLLAALAFAGLQRRA